MKKIIFSCAERSEAQASKQASRNVSLDLLKILACCAVVSLHCLRKSSVDGAVQYHPYLYYACRFAIPIFFMINGFFQLQKPQISWKYSLKKVFRITFVVIAWITICNTLKIVTGHGIWWPDYWRWIMQGGNFGVFWYFGALMLIMAFLPIVSSIFHHSKLRCSFFLLLFLISTTVDLYSIYNIYQGEMFVQEKIPQMFRMWTWLLYYFIGGQLAEFIHSENFIRFRKVILLSVLPITCCSIAWQYYLCYFRIGCVNSEYMYDSPLIIIWCSIIMLCCLYLNQVKLRRTIIELSACGLSVYAMHMTIVMLMVKRFNFNSWAMNLLLIAIVLFLSYSFSIVMRRVPIIKLITHI